MRRRPRRSAGNTAARRATADYAPRSPIRASTRSSSPCRRASTCDLTLRGARRRQARARREAGVSAAGGLPGGRGGARRGGPRRARRRERSLQAAGRDAAPAAGRRRHRRDGVRALHDASRRRLKTADDWRNDETMAGGDAFFEEGIHWLHLAGSLGPAIVTDRTAIGRRPSRDGPRPARQEHDGGVPLRQRRRRVAVLLARGPVAAAGAAAVEALRAQRHHHVRVERRCSSLVRGTGLAADCCLPGFRDIRGYQAMYRDFVRAIRDSGARPR